LLLLLLWALVGPLRLLLKAPAGACAALLLLLLWAAVALAAVVPAAASVADLPVAAATAEISQPGVATVVIPL
jgi:hypothetical protein